MRRLSSVCVAAAVICCALATASLAEEPRSMDAAYPGLVTGALATAKLTAGLPEGVLVRAGDLTVTAKDFDAKSNEMKMSLGQEQVQKNALFTLETVASDKIVVNAAKTEATKAGRDATNITQQILVDEYLAKVVGEITVTDEEIDQFYKANQGLFCGAPLFQVSGQIKSHLKNQKREDSVAAHVQQLGESTGIEVSAGWVEEKAKLALDNPVDKARTSGKRSFVVFSAGSCCGKDRMLPLVQGMQGKYGDQLNVVYVNAKTEQLLCERYRVLSIPTEVLYDEGGRESWRNVGLVDDIEIDALLAK